MSFGWNIILCHIILIVFDAVQLVEPSPDKVNLSPDEVKSHHWSKMACPLLACNQWKFFIVITNLIHNLEQYHLVGLIVMYAFMQHCLFLICSHIHPKWFDAGLTCPIHQCKNAFWVPDKWRPFLISPCLLYQEQNLWTVAKISYNSCYGNPICLLMINMPCGESTVVHAEQALTHWGRDKMAAFSQMTLSNAFSWMKILEFWLKFHWSLFLRVQLTIFQHWFR